MTDTIAHRGPDDDGSWSDDARGVGFGHRRLSILDLSACGHQPMESPGGRFAVVFNGEIYNFREVREALAARGRAFRGHSDTEVMLIAFEEWGVAEALPRLAGMFAMALWDRQERVLHLIRDRLGEKPLYYGWCGQTLLFGSELKAMRAHPAWRGTIDRDALALYLRHGYVPAPYTIYAGIRKALPGTMLTFSSVAGGAPPVEFAYWSARDTAERGIREPLAGSDAEIVEECDRLLRRTVRQEMESDVPLGAFLSGGVDSSLIVALMQAQSTAPVRTFTIGFNEAEYNEATHAAAVAKHLGTAHTSLYVTAQQTLDVIPRLPAMFDEPFADSSQIPTFLVAQLARQDVTVSLSGDGGDELFGGYNRYFWGERIWRRMRPVPGAVRRSMAGALTSLSPQRWDRLYGGLSGALPARFRTKMPGDRLHKLAGMLDVDSGEAMYHGLTSIWSRPLDVVIGATEPPTVLTDGERWLTAGNFVQQMMYLDMVSYLPDDILVKVDRASMAVSLESRAPFLDHRIAEFAWRVPHHMKIRDGQGKWILRQVLDRYVPRPLIERPKMGFAVPIDQWLRGPLRDWAAELLDPRRMAAEGYFNPAPVQAKWDEHLRGTRNWQYPLWGVLMFQAWLAEQGQ